MRDKWRRVNPRDDAASRRRPRGDVMQQQAHAMREFFIRRAIRQARLAQKKRERADRRE